MIDRAASIILVREASGGEDHEVFLVLRSPSLRFLGGYLAFPGGRLDDGDAELPVAGAAGRRAEGALHRDDAALIACAARELFEETGLLVATHAVEGEGGVVEGEGGAVEGLARLRGSLLAEGDGGLFRGFLAARGLAIDGAAFEPAARLVTPPISALRYDTTFFLVDAAGRGEPEVLAGELAGGAWHRPAGALEAWRRGEARIAPPVVAILEELAARPLPAAAARLRALPAEFEGSGRAIAAAPGYDLIPLETPPLPPHFPTNTFLVGGERFIIIDPAPRTERGRDHLVQAIDARLARGDRLEAIVLTHHHPDHVGALELVAARYRAPVWAHPRTGELLARGLERELDEGDEVVLGGDGGPGGGFHLRVLFTPGHAEGHIALHDPARRCLIGGDLLSTLTSMYVGSPGGSLRRYFASLERVAALDLDTFYPSHGAPTHEPAKLVGETIRHRRQRIEEVLGRLGSEPRSTEDLALETYAGLDRELRPLFVRTTRAALEYLAEEGRAAEVGADRYVRRSPANRPAG